MLFLHESSTLSSKQTARRDACSFLLCQGSTASLDVCAQELLDLWNNPIVIGCRTYYVVVAQILMDGPGRSKYCKCEGTNSFAGCNICDVTGMYMLVG
jgi:hypothetical protein